MEENGVVKAGLSRKILQVLGKKTVRKRTKGRKRMRVTRRNLKQDDSKKTM